VLLGRKFFFDSHVKPPARDAVPDERFSSGKNLRLCNAFKTAAKTPYRISNCARRQMVLYYLKYKSQ